MIRTEVRTGFEWMDTPFLLTRVFVVAWGSFMAFILFVSVVAVLDDVRRRILPPPPPPPVVSPDGEGPMEIHSQTECWASNRTPYRDLCILFWFSALPIAAMVLVWRRSRLAFLLSGAGWLMIAVVVLIPATLDPEVEVGAGPLSLGLLPPLWLGFAARRVRPLPSTTTDLIIAVDEPDTGFEWMDSALNGLLAPFRKGIAFAVRILRSGS